VLRLEPERAAGDPHPVLLNWADNTSAINWCNQVCKSSLAGRALGRLFCALLMHCNFGINSKWLSTDLNFIADDISRMKSSHVGNANDFAVDFLALKQKYPVLQKC